MHVVVGDTCCIFVDNGDSRRSSFTFGECNHRRKWTHICDFGKVCVVMQRTVNSLHLYSELLIADPKVVTHSFCFCLCSLDGLKLRNVFVVASRVLYAIYRRGWMYMVDAYGAWQLWVQYMLAFFLTNTPMQLLNTVKILSVLLSARGASLSSKSGIVFWELLFALWIEIEECLRSCASKMR